MDRPAIGGRGRGYKNLPCGALDSMTGWEVSFRWQRLSGLTTPLPGAIAVLFEINALSHHARRATAWVPKMSV
jgi:hypothetical protein